MSDDPEFLYKPAKRGGIGVLLMFAAPSGGGKTVSALRVATGLAGGKPIYFLDTESGRALSYAEDFDFMHLNLSEPFTPERFERAAVIAKERAGVLIIDSFSHEHTGPGGLLDMQENELNRLTKNDDNKREQFKYTSWIRPKMQHKHLMARLYQINCHVIFCCHASKKLELQQVRNKAGRLVTQPKPDADFSPVCEPDAVYAMTASFLFDPRSPGVPRWLKKFSKFEPLIDMTKPLDEATGERIAAWARGDIVAQIDKARASVSNVGTSSPSDDAPADHDDGIPEEPRENQGALKFARDLAALYLAAKDRAAYFKLLDDEVNRRNVENLKKYENAIFKRELERIMKATFERTAPSQQPAGSAESPSTETPSDEQPPGEELPL